MSQMNPATDLPLVLEQDRLARILEYDVVLRTAAPEFQLDLIVEVFLLVLRFPITERQTQLRIDQRAIDVAAVLGQRVELALRDEDQVLRAAPVLEQRLERRADDRFWRLAG